MCYELPVIAILKKKEYNYSKAFFSINERKKYSLVKCVLHVQVIKKYIHVF